MYLYIYRSIFQTEMLDFKLIFWMVLHCKINKIIKLKNILLYFIKSLHEVKIIHLNIIVNNEIFYISFISKKIIIYAKKKSIQ